MFTKLLLITKVNSTCLYFVGYVMMYVAHGLLVTMSRDKSSSYSYNTITVVLLSEILKLFLASVSYMHE